MIRTILLAGVVLTAPATAQTAPAAAPAPAVERRVQGAATLENIPPVPPELAAGVSRYQQGRSASVADWLPDGAMLIATRFGATAQLHRVAAPGADRRQLTFAAEPIPGGRAIPNSDRILFARDTGGDEWFQLFVLAPDGSAAQLTEPGTRNLGPVFARDGRRVYWSRATRGSADYGIWSADPSDPASRALVYQGQGALDVADVSPDGTALLLTRRVSNREQALFLLDLGTKALRPVAAGRPALLSGARFGPGGASVIAVSDRGSDVKRLVRFDLKGGAPVPLLPAGQWNVEDFDLSDDGRLLAYAVNEDGYSRVGLLDLSGTGNGRALPAPKLPAGVVTGMRLSPDGRRLAVGLSSATAPGDAWAVDTATGTAERWTLSEIGPVDAAALPEPRLIRFRSFDGLSVPAFVYRPKAAAAGARTPVLISIHGGPEAQARPGWSPTVASFADNLGATVIVPNVRGSDGYGTRYLNLDNAEKREDSVKDIGALLDWIGRQPDLDPARVAVIGGSYGGYMSLAAMTRYSDRLAGGVELFGIGDFETFLKNTEAYRRDNRRAEYGDERTARMQAAFKRISPRNNVAGITKPMLVEQGANDPRVPRSESEQMVAALRARGVPVSYLLFADEGHGWRKKPNSDLSLQVETQFLRDLLNPAPTAPAAPPAAP